MIKVGASNEANRISWVKKTLKKFPKEVEFLMLEEDNKRIN